MIDNIFLQKKILTEQNYITKEDAEKAEAYEKTGNGSFVDYLLREGILNKDTLGLAIAEYYKVSYTDLDSLSSSAVELAKIPEDFARKYRVIFVKEKSKDKTVVLATDVPDEPDLIKGLKKIFPKDKITITYSFTESVNTS